MCLLINLNANKVNAAHCRAMAQDNSTANSNTAHLLRLEESIAIELCRCHTHGAIVTSVTGVGSVTRQPQAQVGVRFAVDQHQQWLMCGGGNAVPATVEWVGHSRAHHVIEVHQRQLHVTTTSKLSCTSNMRY